MTMVLSGNDYLVLGVIRVTPSGFFSSRNKFETTSVD